MWLEEEEDNHDKEKRSGIEEKKILKEDNHNKETRQGEDNYKKGIKSTAMRRRIRRSVQG